MKSAWGKHEENGNQIHVVKAESLEVFPCAIGRAIIDDDEMLPQVANWRSPYALDDWAIVAASLKAGVIVPRGSMPGRREHIAPPSRLDEGQPADTVIVDGLKFCLRGETLESW